jgi:hypothetical protein
VGVSTTSVYADANTNLTVDGSIGYKSGSSPMLYMYESGTLNQTKRVISHSPGFPTFGLIYNDSTDDFYFSGTALGIGTSAPAALLHVNGSAGNNTGVWSNLSDRRLKKEIEPISGALQSVLQLKGVTFRWKDEEMDQEFGRVRGLVAQDVEKVIPEWIKTDPDGYKRLEPIGIDALLIEAIKEQQKTIEELRSEVGDLKELMEKLLSTGREKKSNWSLPQTTRASVRTPLLSFCLQVHLRLLGAEVQVAAVVGQGDADGPVAGHAGGGGKRSVGRKIVAVHLRAVVVQNH